ncbi:MAG: hypothetical protein ACRDQA_16895 [Nocardioidaceae bacterium]
MTATRKRGEIDQLVRTAEQARRRRAHDVHPDVVALRVERVRGQVDRLMWAGIVLGLAFTATNVASFAAAGTEPWSPEWAIGWLLDPMVSLVLVAVLRAEQLTARYQVATGAWVRRAKWGCLAATYVMNTWQSWAAGSPAGIVLHSVPPLVVLVAVEAVTDLRHKLTEVATRAGARPVVNKPANQGEAESVNSPTPVREPSTTTAAQRSRPSTGAGRKLLADYVTDAHAALAREPVPEVTPAWARRVTGCSKGLSAKVAAAIREHPQLVAVNDHQSERSAA